MMIKENQNKKEDLILQSLKPWDNATALVEFFYQNRNVTINESYNSLDFWFKIFLENDEMNSKSARKEFLQALNLIKELKELTAKFTDDDVHETLNSITLHRKLAYLSMQENYEKEVHHA